MITNMLKTSSTLLEQSAVEREPLHRSEGNEYRDEFATLLAQISGQEERGNDIKTPQNKALEHDAEQPRLSENTDATRDAVKETHVIQSEKGSTKADPVKGEVSHKTDKLNQKAPVGVRLETLADKLSKMGASHRVERSESYVKNNAALSIGEDKKQKQKGSTAVVKNHRQPTLQGKEVVLAVHRKAVKITPDKVMKNQEFHTVDNKTGEKIRSLKMNMLRSSASSADKGVSLNLHEITVNMKNEPRESFSAKAKNVVEGLHETVLSKYEGSAKVADIKPHYQSVQNADMHFDEIIRQFTLLMRKGGGEAKLLLQPEHLGSLKLRIQVDRGEVATTMLVDNQAVKDLILSRLNILEESLLEHGFDLGSFDVGVKGESGDGDTAAGTARGNSSGAGGGEVALVEDDPVAGQGTAYLPWMSTRINITV